MSEPKSEVAAADPSPDLAAATAPASAFEPAAEALVCEELLVEDISIDGMCGVY